MKGCILISVFFIVGCAGMRGPRDPWTTTDTVLQVTYSALHIMDWSQTLHIARNSEKYYETNPILGEHPSTGRVNTYFAVTLLANTVIPMHLNKPYRNIWQGIWIINQYTYVQHNRRISIGITLGF